ncbi:MAG: glycoside hydrolase family 127 protein, partial [Muribaculaceae bacterium]|nr:glycoside hydrolase family 127 protein [Muribaculaceae bacterium]
RIPSWTEPGGVKLYVNGSEQKSVISNGYLSVERKWRDGDALTVTLPMHLSVEQLPDKSSNYSFLYGPVVLGADLGHEGQDGLFADESRMGHVASGPILPLQEMPVIVGVADSLLSYIKTVDPKTLTFSLSHVYPHKYEGMRLVPFASLNECRYMVYWPVISPDELQTKLRQTALRQAEKQALLQHTADVVVCGEQQPESDHFIEMSNSWSGLAGDAHWRGAGPDGRFSYTMKKRSKAPNTLRIYYKQAPDNAATITADGKTIGSIEPAPRTGELLHTDFPVEMTADEVRITVAGKNFNTPEVYELRLMEM